MKTLKSVSVFAFLLLCNAILAQDFQKANENFFDDLKGEWRLEKLEPIEYEKGTLPKGLSKDFSEYKIFLSIENSSFGKGVGVKIDGTLKNLETDEKHDLKAYEIWKYSKNDNSFYSIVLQENDVEIIKGLRENENTIILKDEKSTYQLKFRIDSKDKLTFIETFYNSKGKKQLYGLNRTWVRTK